MAFYTSAAGKNHNLFRLSQRVNCTAQRFFRHMSYGSNTTYIRVSSDDGIVMRTKKEDDAYKVFIDDLNKS